MFFLFEFFKQNFMSIVSELQMIAPHVSKLYMSTVAGAEKLEETTDQSSGPLSISAPISEGDAEIEELSSSDSFFD